MHPWQGLLSADPLPWLLEEENPSVRYFTLRHLLDRPALDPNVLEARSAIMQSAPVTKILAAQQPGGYWGDPQNFYLKAKYRGTVWTLIVLAELGADGAEPRLRAAVEYLLQHSQERSSGGFAYFSAATGGGDRDGLIPCLSGNMLFCLLRFGCLQDPRVQRAIQWAVRTPRLDDGGIPAPRGWPYERRLNCWGRHSCHMGVVKVLKALAEIPADQRTPEVEEFAGMAAEYLLKHRIYFRSHHPEKIAMPRWLQYGFPRMYDTDALEILWLLARLGIRDERMQPAVDRLLERQDETGRWVLDASWNGRTLARIEQVGLPSKWITLRALTVLRHATAEVVAV